MMIVTLYQIADELRGLANLGLLFAENVYDKERYQKVLTASARIVAAIEGCSAESVVNQYRKNFTHMSPLAGAGTVLFKGSEILLMKRNDDSRWAIPGGLVEIGETASETAKRELYEEVGIHGEIKQLLGVFDSRIWKSKTMTQLFHFVFLIDTTDPTPHISTEAIDVGFFSEDSLPPLSPGHHLRVPFFFRQLRGEAPIPFYDG